MMEALVIEQTLEAVGADLAAAGEPVFPGADDGTIQDARRRVQAVLNAQLPDGYAAFLRRHDGLEFDGVVFYSTAPKDEFWQGLVEANETWRDATENEKLLILGDDDMSFYAVDLSGERPTKRDRVNGEVVETFGTIDEMIDAALRSRL